MNEPSLLWVVVIQPHLIEPCRNSPSLEKMFRQPTKLLATRVDRQHATIWISYKMLVMTRHFDHTLRHESIDLANDRFATFDRIEQLPRAFDRCLIAPAHCIANPSR